MQPTKVAPTLDKLSFNPSYQASRARFLAAARQAGFDLETYEHPRLGRQGEALAIDVASLGSESARRVVLCSSGVHGVEGIAGSACQSHFLELEFAGGSSVMREKLLDDVKLVLVHAINPYGFSFSRRTNENNVDLNRNFVNFEHFECQNSLYDDIHSLLIDSCRGEWQLTRDTLEIFAAEFGLDKLQAALTLGQFRNPAGLFYGGTEAQWSNLVFKEILGRHLHTAETVAFLDIHTGLGPSGHGELIFNGSPNSADYRVSREVFGGDVKATQAGEASASFSHGLILNALGMKKRKFQLASSTLEFGTIEFKEMLTSLAVECWHAHNDSDPEVRVRASRDLESAFYIADELWERAVLSRSHSVLSRSILSLGM